MGRAVGESPASALNGLVVEAFIEGQVLLACPFTHMAFLAPCKHLDDNGMEVPEGDPDALAWTDPTDTCLQ